MRLRLAIRFGREVVRPILGVTIKTKEGVTVFGTNTERLADARMRDVGRAGSVITATVGFDCRLAPGDYFVSLGLASRQGDGVTPHDRRYDAIHLHVGSEERLFGLVDLGMTIDTSAADGSV
jgi:lipopolysaccharide transport system ATP-binding protein